MFHPQESISNLQETSEHTEIKLVYFHLDSLEVRPIIKDIIVLLELKRVDSSHSQVYHVRIENITREDHTLRKSHRLDQSRTFLVMKNHHTSTQIHMNNSKEIFHHP